ncbi:MAG: Serine/threonine protein kinase, partial [Parcubacteria group bacterium GW2011_GWA2_47_7]
MDEQIHTRQFKGYSLGAQSTNNGALATEHAPPLRDAGLQGRWFHVIEDRTGMLSLREALELHGPIDAPSCVERAGALARVLTSLHGLGAVCGFLNPDNVYLNDDGSFVLGDFLTPAFVYVYHREAGRPIGLVNCMAPELLRGEANGPRADVFALAALIYRAVTGRSPFTLETGKGPPWDVRGVPVDAGLYGQGCNRHFSQVLRWALAPDPDHRPPSPHRFIMDLRATFLDPGDGQAAPEPASRVRGRKTR